MAVPMTVKMPEPTTAPMPNAVSETGPRVFLSAVSGASDSSMSLSMDFVAKICRGSARSSSFQVCGQQRLYAGPVRTARENASRGDTCCGGPGAIFLRMVGWLVGWLAGRLGVFGKTMERVGRGGAACSALPLQNEAAPFQDRGFKLEPHQKPDLAEGVSCFERARLFSSKSPQNRHPERRLSRLYARAGVEGPATRPVPPQMSAAFWRESSTIGRQNAWQAPPVRR